MSNFIEEKLAAFKKRCRELDGDPVVVVPKPRYEEPAKARLFNIHKRSLPTGIDEIVVRNLTKAEAVAWVCPDLPKLPRLKTKLYHDDTTDTKTYIYYDLVPVDATPRERSIYFNPRPIVINE